MSDDDVVYYSPEMTAMQTAVARFYLTVMEDTDKIAKEVHRVNTLGVWTLTVDHDPEIVTTVHLSKEAAVKALFAEHDPWSIYDGDLQALIDGECLVVKIESHQLRLAS